MTGLWHARPRKEGRSALLPSPPAGTLTSRRQEPGSRPWARGGGRAGGRQGSLRPGSAREHIRLPGQAAHLLRAPAPFSALHTPASLRPKADGGYASSDTGETRLGRQAPARSSTPRAAWSGCPSCALWALPRCCTSPAGSGHHSGRVPLRQPPSLLGPFLRRQRRSVLSLTLWRRTCRVRRRGWPAQAQAELAAMPCAAPG